MALFETRCFDRCRKVGLFVSVMVDIPFLPAKEPMERPDHYHAFFFFFFFFFFFYFIFWNDVL